MAMAASVALMALTAGSASASVHPFLEAFGSAAQPTFGFPEGVAVDQSSGDVLVVDREQSSLFRYNPDGSGAGFAALGSNVIDGAKGPENKECAEEASSCDLTPQGSLSFANPPHTQLAVDNSGTVTDGDLYVAQPESNLIDIFSSAGAYLGQLTESSEGPLGTACGVAVAPNGTVYVGDESGKIHKYVPSGNPVANADNTANFSYPEACTLAVGTGPTAGFIFVDTGSGGELSKMDASSGEVKYTITSEARTVSVDPATGHVYVATPEGFTEYDASGAASATVVSQTNVGAFGRGVAVRGSTGNVYLAMVGQETLQVYGPLVVTPLPTIEPASGVNATEATLNGKVNPEGLAITECKFEYGLGFEFDKSAPCEGSIPTDSSDHPVSATIGGLEPNGAEYRFRLSVKTAEGTYTSGVESFATETTIEVSPGAATEITGTEATLNGTLNPLGNEVTGCRFEYGAPLESDFAFSVPCEQSIPTDSSPHSVSAKIAGLAGDGSQYKFRLVGTNSYGPRASFQLSFNVDTTATAEPATGVTQSSATLRGSVKTDGQPLSDCELEYGTDGSYGQSAPCNPAAGSIPVDSSPHAVSANVSGLQESTTYYFRVSTTNAGGTVHSSGLTFQTPGAPKVSGESSIANQTSALIGGYVDPRGSATTYSFEWGPTASYGNTAPAGPEPSAGSGTEPVPAEAKLSGLEVGQTYHFRLVATNANGTSQGPDETFTTYRPSGLPDNRRYEQVSPVEKNDSGVLHYGAAAVDGNRLMFSSPGSFAGQPTSLVTAATQYLATRGQTGWTTKGIALPNAAFALPDGYVGVNPDLSKGVVGWDEASRFGGYDPSAPRGKNLYLHDSESGSFQLLNGTLGSTSDPGGFVSGTPDFGKIAIETQVGLTPGASCGLHVFDECTYEWDHGTLRLASLLPNGEPVAGSLDDVRNCNSEHVLSEDGSRLFFETGNVSGGNIYVREDGTSSSLVTASERGKGGFVDQGAFFQDAEAAHGDKVLFSTAAPLVEADNNSTRDLYLYDFTKPAGERLTLVSEDENPEAPSGADLSAGSINTVCGGLVAASEDLSRIYFVAENQIVGGAPNTPGSKLYLWQANASPHSTYIATLPKGEVNSEDGLASAGVERRGSRWSADGRYLAFASSARLTPFDNEGQREIYRYDAESGALDCVTCSSDAFPAEGSVEFNRHWSLVALKNHMRQNVSSDGNVFFETTRGLVPGDSNGARDVYEYENGQLRLISRGTGVGDSDFLDASPSGNDVFFATADHLVGWDKDQNVDAYDARVNGGLPEPPPPPNRCEGEACLPAPNAPNDATPASSSFEGSGNVSEAPRAGRCSKGKVRRHGRCVKKRRAHKKQGRHGRTATRSHG